MSEEPEGNDARLVIRLATSDDEWLSQQGKEIGVGKAVVARLLIQWAHRRNLSMYQLMAWLAQASQAAPTAPVQASEEAPQITYEMRDDLPEEEIDAVVAAQLEAAERSGQVSARAVAAAQPHEDAPIRALRVVPRQPGKAWAGGG